MDVTNSVELVQKYQNCQLYRSVFSDQWLKIAFRKWMLWVLERIILLQNLWTGFTGPQKKKKRKKRSVPNDKNDTREISITAKWIAHVTHGEKIKM